MTYTHSFLELTGQKQLAENDKFLMQLGPYFNGLRSKLGYQW